MRKTMIFLLASGCAASPALAQDAAAALTTTTATPKSDEGLNEIIVTATRREAKLQDVGIAISAFTGRTLRDLAVTSTEQLTAITPGLQLSLGGGTPLVGLLSIRGVSQMISPGISKRPTPSMSTTSTSRRSRPASSNSTMSSASRFSRDRRGLFTDVTLRAGRSTSCRASRSSANSRARLRSSLATTTPCASTPR